MHRLLIAEREARPNPIPLTAARAWLRIPLTAVCIASSSLSGLPGSAPATHAELRETIARRTDPPCTWADRWLHAGWYNAAMHRACVGRRTPHVARGEVHTVPIVRTDWISEHYDRTVPILRAPKLRCECSQETATSALHPCESLMSRFDSDSIARTGLGCAPKYTKSRSWVA